MQTDERVIVIQGDATKWYSQAVFIMNPNQPEEKTPVDFVAEAEKIIFNYVARKNKFAPEATHAYSDWGIPVVLSSKKTTQSVPSVKRRRRIRPSFLLYGLMVVACVALAAIVAFGWLT